MSLEELRTKKRMIVMTFLLLSPLYITGIDSGFVETCNSSPQIYQCGVAVVTISTGFSFGSTTVTFSPAFSTIPFVTLTSRSAGPIGNFPLQSLSFLSIETAGQTWNAFPSAVTEIFGDTLGEHRIIGSSGISFNGVVTAVFSVDCPAGVSTFGTPTLAPQYSLNGGITWNPVSQSGPGLNVALTGCGSGSSLSAFDSVATAIFTSSSQVLFRVVGFNGDDFADNAKLTNVQLLFYGSVRSLGINRNNLSSSTLIIQVIIPVVSSTTITINVEWQAHT